MAHTTGTLVASVSRGHCQEIKGRVNPLTYTAPRTTGKVAVLVLLWYFSQLPLESQEELSPSGAGTLFRRVGSSEVIGYGSGSRGAISG